MKDIIISTDLLIKTIEEAMPEVLKDKLSSTYSNPFAKVIEEELNNKEGQIRTLVVEIISRAVNDEAFKKRLEEKVLETIIAKGLK